MGWTMSNAQPGLIEYSEEFSQRQAESRHDRRLEGRLGSERLPVAVAFEDFH